MPLKRYRWLRAHGRPIDLLLPLLAVVLLGLAAALWWPRPASPPTPPPCATAQVGTAPHDGDGGGG